MRLKWICSFIFILLSWAVQARSDFVIGISSADITGPSYEIPFMGYGKLGQTGRGIKTRLYAKAFFIENPNVSKSPLVIVTTDLAMISNLIKIHVVAELKKQIGNVIGDSNLMILGSHNHSGPGGFFRPNSFYNSIIDFQPHNFERIVSGISEAIIGAYNNRGPGTLTYAKGTLKGASTNRSLVPYLSNKDADPTMSVDQTMHQLMFWRAGKIKGLINWFANHTTSIGNKNRHINSDNKGLSSLLVEKQLGIIAGFANGAAGDVSPNVFSENEKISDWEKNQIIAQKQANLSLKLVQQKGQPLNGKQMRFSHKWLDLNSLANTCSPALGFSFAAGAEDGPSDLPGFKEGMRIDEPLPFALKTLFEIASFIFPQVGSGKNEKCHYPKRVLFPIGEISAAPKRLPFQIFQIDNLIILGAPAELTTISSRRIFDRIKPLFADLKASEIVFSGYANGYGGYITTPEEYDHQHYEGGHNIFGQGSLNAYMNIYEAMAQEWLVNAELLSSEDSPPVIDLHEFPQEKATLISDYRFSGRISRDAKKNYVTGSSIKIEFWSYYYFNSKNPILNYIEVQRKVGDQFVTFLTDKDPETTITWKRSGSHFKAEIIWETNELSVPGKYRIRHTGGIDVKGKSRDFMGQSRVFKLKGKK